MNKINWIQIHEKKEIREEFTYAKSKCNNKVTQIICGLILLRLQAIIFLSVYNKKEHSRLPKEEDG